MRVPVLHIVIVVARFAVTFALAVPSEGDTDNTAKQRPTEWPGSGGSFALTARRLLVGRAHGRCRFGRMRG